MQFGYFTLSDNHYADNLRDANRLIQDILDETVYADALGYHSAWIGEHHFNSLGVLSCPDLVLAHAAARTKKIRLAPAVTVLPLHNPIGVAEQWATLDLLSGGRVDWAAGRGYDRREYEPFGVDFDDNQAIFEEGMALVQRLWSTGGERISHHGKYYRFEDVRITPQPLQKPIPSYVASFSKPSVELAARLGCGLIVAPFAAAMTFGGLKQVADLGCDVKVVNRIVNGRTSVTAAMALKLGATFRTTPEFWLNAQKAVDLYRAANSLHALPEPMVHRTAVE
jgi:addiction module HigA family antidote